jgi:REP element-mobilizing transposase RayT
LKDYQNKYNSGTNRWEIWDYSAPGAYYITICTYKKEPLFGQIVNGKMELSPEGEIVDKYFKEIESWDSRLLLDEYIIMPDHLHFILIIRNKDFKLPVRHREEVSYYYVSNIDTINQLFRDGMKESKKNLKQFQEEEKLSDKEWRVYNKLRRGMLISKVNGKFKMQISKEINRLNDTPGKTNWQRDSFDRIIMDSKSYFRIKDYIKNNPENWKKK